jgi:hypothetical protein
MEFIVLLDFSFNSSILELVLCKTSSSFINSLTRQLINSTTRLLKMPFSLLSLHLRVKLAKKLGRLALKYGKSMENLEKNSLKAISLKRLFDTLRGSFGRGNAELPIV